MVGHQERAHDDQNVRPRPLGSNLVGSEFVGDLAPKIRELLLDGYPFDSGDPKGLWFSGWRSYSPSTIDL